MAPEIPHDVLAKPLVCIAVRRSRLRSRKLKSFDLFVGDGCRGFGDQKDEVQAPLARMNAKI
jgi:hypothetical protein